jgi:hypothetical protein
MSGRATLRVTPLYNPVRDDQSAFTQSRPLPTREMQSSVGLVVAVCSHESATFQKGVGHFGGRVAQLATNQDFLDFSRRESVLTGVEARW